MIGMQKNSTGSRDQIFFKKIWPKFYRINFWESHKISIRSKTTFRSYYKKIDADGLVGPPAPCPLPPPPSLHRVKSLSQEFDSNVLDLIKKKGFYLYEYMINFEKIKKKLPHKKRFYSLLNELVAKNK